MALHSAKLSLHKNHSHIQRTPITRLWFLCWLLSFSNSAFKELHFILSFVLGMWVVGSVLTWQILCDLIHQLVLNGRHCPYHCQCEWLALSLLLRMWVVGEYWLSVSTDLAVNQYNLGVSQYWLCQSVSTDLADSLSFLSSFSTEWWSLSQILRIWVVFQSVIINSMFPNMWNWIVPQRDN